MDFKFLSCLIPVKFLAISQGHRCARDLIRLSSFALSLRPLHSLDHHDLFVPRARTSMAQTILTCPSICQLLLIVMDVTLTNVEELSKVPKLAAPYVF